eukprot:215270-Chlamydomonas_euryale.AAC.6
MSCVHAFGLAVQLPAYRLLAGRLRGYAHLVVDCAYTAPGNKKRTKTVAVKAGSSLASVQLAGVRFD